MALTEGQKRCIETLDRPLVVAAGAGSGKTFTLTQRIAGALQSGFLSDIDEVCAITFTRKAAAELKSRLKGELRARNLIDQALKVDDAWVSTIHGMCARILRAHALELGIDPAFTVAESVQVQRYLDKAVDSVLVETQADGSSVRLDDLFAEYPARSTGGFGVSVESMLTRLVEAAASQADGVDSFVLPGVTVSPHYAVESAADVMETMLALAADQKASVKRDEWMASTESQIGEVRSALEQGVNDAAEALALIAPFKLAKTFGSKDFKARVDEARGELGAYVMEVRLGLASTHLETLLELTRRALAEFARLKREDGALDNNDLLVQAARALEDHPAIAACYSNRFKLVMVDEFQDTDQMQVDMIKRLSGEGACRLCTVGDSQQSIYRFRGADVSVYRRHLQSIESSWDDSVIRLSKNFRSHADVLSFVDKVFGQPEMFGNEFMSLSHGRDEERVKMPYSPHHNRIMVQHTSIPWRGVPRGEACQLAARRIASRFADLAAAGHSAGEMVVLLGRMTNADVYAQALRDVGLPCVISGGSVFARTPEVGVMRELVRAIANPYETQSLFNVLTSPLFALSAGDLLEVGRLEGFRKTARNWFRGQEEEGAKTDDLSPQLDVALRVMGSAWKAVDAGPMSRIVEQVVVDSGWLSRLERGGAEGLASAGNVYKAIRMLQHAEQGGAYGPVSTMRAFEDAIEGSKEAPGALSVSGGNSVRIMTIHASKGLEFPIVAIADMKESGASSSRLLMSSLGGNVYLSLDLSRSLEDGGGSVTFDEVRDYVLGDVAGEDELAAAVVEEAGALHRRLALRDYLAAGDDEEAKRLLYVAITRAKESVIVSSTGKRTKANPLGMPKSVVVGIFDALDPAGTAIGEGVSRIEYGGSELAEVECVNLEASDELSEDDVIQESPVRESFLIPAVEERPVSERVVFRPLHEGIFSYSSMSDSSHGGGMLSRLVDAFAVAVDEGCVDDGRGGDGDSTLKGAKKKLRLALGGEDDEWASDAPSALDEDRATDLGTAFHRLAQYAVLARKADECLSQPPSERVQALARACNLNAEQRERLARALDRWFASDLAREMSGMSHLDAEVPFIVPLPSETGETSFLEGEIDLLGFDEERDYAHVVDYKTGGRAGETADDLRAKHVLQASCYAYAILRQGVKAVDADFVRVERSRADDPAQPQCVRYRFQAGDLPLLERSIAAAYAQG